MAKYRKRPVVVEAVQYFPDRPLPAGVLTNSYEHAPSPHYVVTIHRQHAYLNPGDWVVTESDGVHHYPCTAEEFERIYEPVPDEPAARPPGPPPVPMPKCALCGHPFREHERFTGRCRAHGCGCESYGTGEFA